VRRTSDIKWLSREAEISSYHHSEIYTPYFCSCCGPSVPLIGKAGYCFIPAGALDSDIEAEVSKHIFAGSKASWDNINDDAPQFDAFSPRSLQTRD